VISLNLVLAELRLGLKNCQVGEKWVSDDCSYLCKGLISEKLKEYWSPEQIMGRLELDKKIKISTETAYRFTNTCAISIRNIENAMAKMIIEVGCLIALTLMSAPVLLMLALALATGKLTWLLW
jgi:hypothetical protein